ncbi:helix-turn-helix domain-containing protein [uncultured Bilophila sp.]|uniref:winged helix-turn-helix transcriptional regulator n=1 Tax=uncultured Bilophila sp. TaxID=529385 RepID=UPI00280C1797|nr:helix-turn-helix domain-containing protein [uncultured Bilophila sp.]
MGGRKRAGYRTELPGTNVYTVPCPIIHALHLIGGKWKLPVLWHLFDAEPVRYNELKRSVVGITNIMLTQCLRELEASGLVRREDHGEVPPRVEYSLTERGRELLPALRELYKWGERQLARNAATSPPSA